MASKYDTIKKELSWAERNFHRAIIVDDSFLDHVSSLKATYSELLIKLFSLSQSSKIKRQTWDHYKKIYDIYTEKAEIVWREYSRRDKKTAIQQRFTFDGKEIKKSFYIPLCNIDKYLTELSEATGFAVNCKPSVKSDIDKIKSHYGYHHQGHLYLLAREASSEIRKKIKPEQWDELIQMSLKYELLCDEVISQSNIHKKEQAIAAPSSDAQIEFPSNDAIEKWDNLFVEAKYSRTFLWANALIQQFAKPDIVEVSLIDLCDEMIAISWNFMLDNKPYLYQFDNLRDVIFGIKKYLKLSSELNYTEILDLLQSAHDNPLYIKRASELLSGIPWGFLRAWIPETDIRNIEKVSRKFSNGCMYAVVSSKTGDIIRINPQWKNFILSEKDNLLCYVDNAFKQLIRRYNPKNERLHHKLDTEYILC